MTCVYALNGRCKTSNLTITLSGYEEKVVCRSLQNNGNEQIH